MRINLTKKELVKSIYMQVGFSKLISEHFVDEFFSLLILNLRKEKKLKLFNFGIFLVRSKKSRVGRNPKTRKIRRYPREMWYCLNLQKNLKNL